EVRRLTPATATLPAPPRTEAKRVVVSRFRRGDDEGWTTQNADGSQPATKPIRIVEKSGNYFLTATDIQNGKPWVWLAPAKYRGDHSDAFGRFLKYELWASHSEIDCAGGRYVQLGGAGLTLFADGTALAQPVPRIWMRYCIRLDATGGWKRQLGS